MRKLNFKLVILWMLVVISAMVVVTIRHQNRLAFIALQQQENEKIELQSEWGRLMLERATWSMHNTVAGDASKRLAMTPPPPDKIVTLELSQD